MLTKGKYNKSSEQNEFFSIAMSTEKLNHATEQKKSVYFMNIKSYSISK